MFHLYDLLLTYLGDWCHSAAALKRAILHDMQLESVKCDLQVLGLVDKHITGPWMHLTYRPDTNEAHHLSMVPKIKDALSKLESGSGDILNKPVDIFGNSIADDPVYLSLTQTIPESVRVKFRGISLQISAVIQKQYKKYLEKTFTKADHQKTENAPLTNMQSERFMGQADRLNVISPNANTDYLSAIIRGKHNQTIRWLNGKSLTEKEQLVYFVVNRGRKKRQLYKQRQHEVQQEKLAGIKLKKQENDAKDRRVVERKIKRIIGGEEVNEVFPDIHEKKDIITSMLLDPKSVVKKKFVQDFEVNPGDRKQYDGTILSAAYKRNVWKYAVVYGDPNDSTNDEYTFTLIQILADIVLGDFSFIY